MVQYLTTLFKSAALALVILTAAAASMPAPLLARSAAVVIDGDTGAVLYQKNMNHRHYPASLTKMMTLYLLFEAIESGDVTLRSSFKVSARAAGQPNSKLGLRKGKRIRVSHAILALIVKSANDVATVVAEGLAGSEVAFARKMTAKAKALGMKRTSFRNASGLPNRGQLSTARDMAQLARALYLDFPRYYKFFAATSFRYGGKTYRGHNKFVSSYDGADGLKTGYIRASKFNLAASAKRRGQRLFAVVFGARSPDRRDREMANLLDGAFSEIAQTRVASVTFSPPPRSASGGLPPPPPPKPVIDTVGAPWAIQVGAFSRIGRLCGGRDQPEAYSGHRGARRRAHRAGGGRRRRALPRALRRGELARSAARLQDPHRQAPRLRSRPAFLR
ncbi:MAG: D-alanyl-D-alanine carboxypeptidase [Proteobacteria bacterium]|nr:D-alanyl-D-alanine carboxypeptidase [Pseudomonadota bacterium]